MLNKFRSSNFKMENSCSSQDVYGLLQTLAAAYDGNTEVLDIQNNMDVSIDDDELDKEAFIEEVRKFKCLWDINDPSYKERTTKLNAWKALSTIFRKDGKYFT